jgi:pimeloyl-ACP methyl ester carboxylesterase
MPVIEARPALRASIPWAESDRASSTGIVFLHGVMRRRETFAALSAAFGASWRVGGIDFQGHGESERWPGHYLVADYVSATVGLLAERCREPVVLYGHSLGAMVAAGVAAARPDLVRAIVLEDPPFETMGAKIEESPWYGYFASIFGLVRDTAFSAAPVAEQSKRLCDLEVPDLATRRARRLGEMRNAVAIRFLASCLRRMDPEVLAPVVGGRWLDRFDWKEAAARISAPVLLIQADPKVGGMLTDADAEAFALRAPDVTRVTLAGAGHNLHVERSTDVINLTTQFLSCQTESRGAP